MTRADQGHIPVAEGLTMRIATTRPSPRGRDWGTDVSVQ